MKILTDDWGLTPYDEAWQRQTALFDALVLAKSEGRERVNRIVFCEHPPVYTLGRSGRETNLLVSEEQLQCMGASFRRVDRGGDITYHGPGQVVCYPILDLETLRLGLRSYIHVLEQAVILTCADYGVPCGRMEGATGVWVDPLLPTARKVCAIGVRSSHFITMHGLALNVNTDLSHFLLIHPCGFRDRGVTSLQRELGREIPMEEVKRQLCAHLTSCLLSNH